MKVLIIDDEGFELTAIAQSENDVEVETLKVEWNEDSITHTSAHEACVEIMSKKPDLIFLDHDLGWHSAFRNCSPENGKDIARILRDMGFSGRLVGTSSNEQSYCDARSGKVRKKTLSELLHFMK